MAEHNLLGKRGEDLAAAWLQQRGYQVLHKNWRHSHYEIDLIALKENKLHFVEVKCRTSPAFGNPEDAVTKKKFKFLLNAADEFLHLHPQYRHVQYDILSIEAYPKTAPTYFLIEDVWL